MPPPPPTDTLTPEATPTPEPTPTPEMSVEMILYTHSMAGFSLFYPEGWVHQAETDGAFFSEGESGDIVTISMIALDEDLDPYLELFAPDGEQVATDDDSGGGFNAAILEFELSLTGTCRVVARSYREYSTGRYELTLTGQ